MSKVHKGLIFATRTQLGPLANLTDVAEALNVAITTVRRHLNAGEIASWAHDLRRIRKANAVERAIQKLKVRAQALGRVPTARESGIHTSVMTKAGGYNVIVKRAGFKPTHKGHPRA